MNRRQFLQMFIVGASSTSIVTSTVGLGFLHECWQRLTIWFSGCRCSVGRDGRRKKLCNKCKELIISQALKTEEGRSALTKAMVEPIRRSLECQAVGRKILMVNELPQGALAYAL